MGDVDFAHYHHGFEDALGFGGEGAGGDLPGEAPAVLAPAAGANATTDGHEWTRMGEMGAKAPRVQVPSSREFPRAKSGGWFYVEIRKSGTDRTEIFGHSAVRQNRRIARMGGWVEG